MKTNQTKYVVRYKVIGPGGVTAKEGIITEGDMKYIQDVLNKIGISNVFDSTNGNKTDNRQYMLIFMLNQLNERGQEETKKETKGKPMDRDAINYWLGELGLGSLPQLEKPVAKFSELEGR